MIYNIVSTHSVDIAMSISIFLWMVAFGLCLRIINRMASTPTKQTLSEEVYASLRTQILGGTFEPGTKLRIAIFAAQYGVSHTVVREAMTRLAGQGLVQASPQRGFCVTPLSIDDLLDLTRARVLIETIALRESITEGDLAWESRVLAAHHTLQGTPDSTREGHVGGEWAQVHQAFHNALLSGSTSRRLESIATELRDCSQLYQHWSVELARGKDRDVAAEHRNIAELTLKRDAEGATRALAEHIERTTATLIEYAEKGTAPARAADIPA